MFGDVELTLKLGNGEFVRISCDPEPVDSSWFDTSMVGGDAFLIEKIN